MTWLVSLFVSVLSGATGLLLAGFIANACVSWYHISSREGNSGYFVMFVGLGGGIAGFIIGLITARVIASNYGPSFGKELGGALGVVLILGGIAVTLCRWLADVPPQLDGRPLVLEVEFRFPNTVRTAKPPTADGSWQFTFASMSGYERRASESGTIQTEAARIESGQWIVPTRVSLFTERGERNVMLAPQDAKEVISFQLPLPRRPGHEFQEWSGWIPRQQANGQPWPADKMSCRFRVQKELPQPSTPTEATSLREAEEIPSQPLSPEEALLESLSQYSDAAPLWSLVGGLPDEKSASLRAIWIARALRVPDLDTEMRQTLTSEYGFYRHGAVAMIVEVSEEALRPTPWASFLAEDAKRTADDIRKLGDLSTHENHQLGKHAQDIARAATRFPRENELLRALSLLREPIAATEPSKLRTDALQSLDEAINHHARIKG